MTNRAVFAVLSSVLCVTLALGAKSDRVLRDPPPGPGSGRDSMPTPDRTGTKGLTAAGGIGTPSRMPGLAGVPVHPQGDIAFVAFMAAESAPLATDLRDSLEGYGMGVTDVPCVSYTPTFTEMCNYEAILVWSRDPFADPTAMGNNLADYVDAGGRLIMFASCWYDSLGLGLGGRIKADSWYQTINYSDSFDLQDRAEGWFDAHNPVTQDMGTYPIHMHYRHNTTLAPGARLLAEWQGGIPFVVWALNIGVTCINCYIGNDSQPTGPSGAWGRLVYNAIEMPNPGIDNAGDAWVSLTLAPNPLAGDVLRVGYDPIHLGPAGVTLLDVSGRAVMKRDLTGSCAGQLSLDLRFLGAGVYLVRLDDGRQSLVRKLVVQR